MADDSALPKTDDTWLQIAREAYTTSTNFIDTNHRDRWEDAIRHFQSRHTSSSKYAQDEWKYRSKVFRPKTRAVVRNNEAAAMAAFFSNQDVVSIEPRNINNPMHVVSAGVNDELLNYHMQETIPWFMICIGALQDAQVIGLVASYQTWEYQEDEDGTVIQDRPIIELIPIENIRLHPSAKWPEVAQSSPYLIRLVPMYVQDVEARMEDPDTKIGGPKWKKHTRGQMQEAMEDIYDETREEREQTGEDKFAIELPRLTNALGSYDVVWCHENFVRVGGKDVVYWTLGTLYRLSDPRPVGEVYPLGGRRPIVIGYSMIETHKALPAGLVDLAKNVQKELNETLNVRLDNQKLAMNKRYFAKRGSNVDIASLLKNVAGSVTLMDNTEGDVKVVDFRDVNPSSYQEQDRLNLDIDELVGTFSSSTIQSNRKMNETVGGMAMLRGSANQLTEYLLRTFSESWVEPVLKQVMALIQDLESDADRLELALMRSGKGQQYNVRYATDQVLKQDIIIRVNVGMGATDPTTKLQNFLLGVTQYANVAKSVPPGMINLAEVGKEIFGRMGFKDGQRFLTMGGMGDPEKQQMMTLLQQAQQAVQQLAAQLEEKQTGHRVKLMETQMREEGQDRRTAAELATRLEEKRLDLQNPVVGESRGGRSV